MTALRDASKKTNPAVDKFPIPPILPDSSPRHASKKSKISVEMSPPLPIVRGSPESPPKKPTKSVESDKGSVPRLAFEPHISLLDSCRGSMLREGEFWGMYSFIVVAMLELILSSFYLNWANTARGSPIRLGMFYYGFYYLQELVIPLCVLFYLCFCVFSAQWLHVKGYLPNFLFVMLHYLGNWLILIGSCILILKNKSWPVSQSSFLVMESLVLCMKNHSYLHVNAELEASSNPEYPANVSFSNYLHFMMCPTLVYQPSYPRTPRIRWGYLFEKILTATGLILVMYHVCVEYVVPTLVRAHERTVIECVLQLILPIACLYLMCFVLVFEAILNGFAEVSRFADRRFYDDWWNSRTFETFSRKWNRPVHQWLLKHVYLRSLSWYHNKISASSFTFIFSAVLHELVLFMITKIFKPYMFVLMLVQIPLIVMTRWMDKSDSRIGNFIFWFGIFTGPSILTSLYAVSYYQTHKGDYELMNTGHVHI